MPLDVQVRDLAIEDRARWAELFAQYRDYYQLDPDPYVLDHVWSWLHDDHHPVSGLAAESTSHGVAGIAHYRMFHRPSTGSVGTWLDDLFVDPFARHAGIGRALIDEVTCRAERAGHSVVRWITAEDNTTARQLYRTLASCTDWVVYDRATQ